jgi:hypothetical protein
MQAALQSLAELSAEQTDAQAGFRLRGVMSLLAIVQREWDTCASNRVGAINRYADVVRRGARLMAGDRGEDLRRVVASVEAGASDLRISALERNLDQLRSAAIDLQTWLEAADGPEAEELLAAIWRAEYEDAKSEDRNRSFW